MHEQEIYVLGIETSCDETAAAVYHTTRGMLSNELFSQIALHTQFGGVLPELASREQLEKIDSIIAHALKKAGITLDEIDYIAVTHKPGLAGSLLVGVSFAKALAWAKKKPLIGVNHLEGHTFSSMIEHQVPFPHLCLTASGGHTSLNRVFDFGKYESIAETLDDAAGEAMDKIAKLMGLPYPGGPVLEKLAAEKKFEDFFDYPRGKPDNLQFSFSGLKTAVLYHLVAQGAYNLKTRQFTKSADADFVLKVASSLHVCIADIFIQKITLALKQYPEMRAITFVGGVACNQYITKRIRDFATERGLAFFSPSKKYCTDNGAMIAFVGHYKAQKKEVSSLTLDIF
jgi:N6-L-threonylcarbamoyladenine synthase